MTRAADLAAFAQNVTTAGGLGANGLAVNSELQFFGTVGGSIASDGPKELFRLTHSRLCSGGIFNISCTRGSYVTTAVYAWSTTHNGTGRGTITQLSSGEYSNHTVILDVASDGSPIVSINFAGPATYPMDYQLSVLKMSGGSVNFGSAGVDWTTVSAGYNRMANYSTLANGFKAVNGAFVGALSKGSGTFKIDHPLESLSETHHLVHSFIEGPRADLIYRGTVELINGSAQVNIDLSAGMTEGTFQTLCRDVQCFTSNESDWDAVKGSVNGNVLTISCQNTSSTATVSWMVVGERQDQHMYDTDWTDDDGRPIIEPLKNPTESDRPTYPEF